MEPQTWDDIKRGDVGIRCCEQASRGSRTRSSAGALPPVYLEWSAPVRVRRVRTSTADRGAFQDPTHVLFSSSNSLWYYIRPEQARFINSPTLFEANRVRNVYPCDWHREHQIVYEKADLMTLYTFGGQMNSGWSSQSMKSDSSMISWLAKVLSRD